MRSTPRNSVRRYSTAGVSLGRNGGSAGLLQGVVIDVRDPAKTVDGVALSVRGHGGAVLDVALRGNRVIRSGLVVRQPEGFRASRLVVRDFTDYGVLVDANDRSRTQLAQPFSLRDLDVAGIKRADPGSSRGRGEACVWVGNPGAVERVRARDCGWTGLWTGTAATGLRVVGVDVDDTRTGVYLEHFTHRSTFEGIRVGRDVRVGLTAEWADPGWGGLPASVDNVIQASRFESWLAGVYLDEGTTRTIIRGSTFDGQRWAAIADYEGIDNAYLRKRLSTDRSRSGGRHARAHPQGTGRWRMTVASVSRTPEHRNDRGAGRFRPPGAGMGCARPGDAPTEPLPAPRLARMTGGKHYGRGARLAIHVARRDGRLVAALPLYVRSHLGLSRGGASSEVDMPLSQIFCVAPDEPSEVAAEIARSIAGSDVDYVDLYGLPRTRRLARELGADARRDRARRVAGARARRGLGRRVSREDFVEDAKPPPPPAAATRRARSARGRRRPGAGRARCGSRGGLQDPRPALGRTTRRFRVRRDAREAVPPGGNPGARATRTCHGSCF